MKKNIDRLPNHDGHSQAPSIIGWREWLALPELGITRMKGKVDTGARTSALHAFNIEPYQQDGQDWVRFTLQPRQHDNQVKQVCHCRIQETRLVTNSGGSKEERFVITTPIMLGNEIWSIEMTLTNRDEMGFRMLLGRTALRGRFRIDPARSYCQGKPGSSKKVITQPQDTGSTQDEEE